MAGPGNHARWTPPKVKQLTLAELRACRDDANPRDFLQFTGALWRAASGPEERSSPMLRLLLDGLTSGA